MELWGVIVGVRSRSPLNPVVFLPRLSDPAEPASVLPPPRASDLLTRQAVAWVCFHPDTAEFLHGLGRHASEGTLDPRAQCPIFEGHPGRLSFLSQWKLSATVHLKT
ncbi:hypothetical protein NN561_001439 [Cricetulus griseus]